MFFFIFAIRAESLLIPFVGAEPTLPAMLGKGSLPGIRGTFPVYYVFRFGRVGNLGRVARTLLGVWVCCSGLVAGLSCSVIIYVLLSPLEAPTKECFCCGAKRFI